MSPSLAVNPALSSELASARAQTDRLFELLPQDTLYSRPIAERHRLIFYLGHLEAFDWNLIGRKTLGITSFRPEFDQLFEFGIDPPVGESPTDQPSDWPDAVEVRAYNTRVREIIDSALERVPEQIVRVAIEHRWMHAETLAYLLHNLPYDQKLQDRQLSAHSAVPVKTGFVEIPAGIATLGQQQGEFGWDNEFGKHQVEVPAFSIGKHKVTNGDYLQFMQATGAGAPNFWIDRNGRWYLRGMFSDIYLPVNAPVYVTHEQASAYAKWAGKRLPSEAQFHRAAYGTPSGAERDHPWGDTKPGEAHGNFDFHRWDPVDVDSTPAGDSAFGVSQLVGNGWEWTNTPFGPFEDFQPFPFYPGYSKNFFDEEHYVMKGGSSRTAASLLRRSFRNWFRPNYPYAYASFRLVEN